MKKGVSTIIGWVLLLGFTIALATTIFLWSKEQIEKSTEEVTRFVEGQLECEEVSINIIISPDSADCESLKITNRGKLKIDQFIIRALNVTDKKDLLVMQNPLMPGGIYDYTNIIFSGYSGDLEIIPIIKSSEKKPPIGCTEKKIIIKCQK